MARAKGIETIVDGAHSFAQFDFKQSDLDCDYFGTSMHKWLYAPKGTGMLYVKRDKIEKLWPLMAAESKQSSDLFEFADIGRLFGFRGHERPEFFDLITLDVKHAGAFWRVEPFVHTGAEVIAIEVALFE